MKLALNVAEGFWGLGVLGFWGFGVLADVIIKKTSRKRKSASKQTTAEAAE